MKNKDIFWDFFVKSHISEVEKMKDRSIFGDVEFWPYDGRYNVKYKFIEDSKVLFTLFGVEYKFVYGLFNKEKGSILFKDGSNTYKGRYVDFGTESGYIDFNYSTNLMCAYSDRYVCSIPDNNFGEVRIEAGEKQFIRQTAAEYYLSKTTAFNVIKEHGGLVVQPKNTDREFFVREDMPINEVFDLIWGEGVERGKKEKRADFKMLLGTENM